MPHASPHLCHTAVMQRTAHMPDGTNGEGPNRRSGLLHVGKLKRCVHKFSTYPYMVSMKAVWLKHKCLWFQTM